MINKESLPDNVELTPEAPEVSEENVEDEGGYEKGGVMTEITKGEVENTIRMVVGNPDKQEQLIGGIDNLEEGEEFLVEGENETRIITVHPQKSPSGRKVYNVYFAKKA